MYSHPTQPKIDSKTYKVPRRPYEKARLDAELKLTGQYGLRNKREIWRVNLALAKIRKAARTLLTLEEKDPRRLFQGNALIRRLIRAGVLDKSMNKLDYVLTSATESANRTFTPFWTLVAAETERSAKTTARQQPAPKKGAPATTASPPPPPPAK